MALKDQKEQLVKHLKGGEAFVSLEGLIDEIPFEKLRERPYGLPYSFYELFYHVVFAQKDILEYAISGDYKASKWPDDYWPKNQILKPGKPGKISKKIILTIEICWKTFC